MFKYLLFLLFTVNNIYAFGFVMQDTQPDIWIYATNFFDVLILTISMIISSFLYLFILNNLVVPLLFLYLVYEVVKFFTIMLKNDNIYQSNLYSGKFIGLFILKVIGLTTFFMGIPTGILVLSASPKDPQNTTVNTITQAYTAFKLNDPVPLDTGKSLKDYHIANGILWSNLPDIPIGQYFMSIPMITELETYQNAPAQITDGVFKVYLPAVIAFPISFAESFLYGTYNSDTGWKPGFLPLIFNNSGDRRTGIFSLLVYDPSLIYDLIFENDSVGRDYAANSFPSFTYTIAVNKFKYLKSLNDYSSKILEVAGLLYMKAFNVSLNKFFYIANPSGTIDITKIINANNLKNPNYKKSSDAKKVIDQFIADISKDLDDFEQKAAQGQFPIANTTVNLYQNLLGSEISDSFFTDVMQKPDNYNYNMDTLYNTEKIVWTYNYLKNLKKFKTPIDSQKFYQLPDVFNIASSIKNTDTQKKILLTYLGKYQFPYFNYVKGIYNATNDMYKFGHFTDTNIEYIQSMKNGIIYFKIKNPLEVFANKYISLSAISDKLKKFTVLYDNNYPYYKSLGSVSNDNVKINGSDSYYNAILNGKSPLWSSLGFEIYSVYILNNFDIQDMSKTLKLDDTSPAGIRKYFKAALQGYTEKVIFPTKLDLGNKWIKDLSEVALDKSNKVFYSPIVVATLNFQSLYNVVKYVIPAQGSKVISKLGEDYVKAIKQLEGGNEDTLKRIRANFQNELQISMSRTAEKVDKYYNEVRTLLNNVRPQYKNLLYNYIYNIENYYLARISKPQELSTNSTDENAKDAAPSVISIFKEGGFLNFIKYWINKFLNFLLGIVKNIGSLFFGLMYSLHTVGIIMIIILFQFQFLFGVIFKNDYDKVFEAFRNYIAYRLIDFVYILILYVMGITVPILLFVASQAALGMIVHFFLELVLLGGVFIFTGKFIAAVFEMVQATDKSLQMGQMFERMGGAINKIGGMTAAYGITKGFYIGATGLKSTLSGLATGGANAVRRYQQVYNAISDPRDRSKLGDRINKAVSAMYGGIPGFFEGLAKGAITSLPENYIHSKKIGKSFGEGRFGDAIGDLMNFKTPTKGSGVVNNLVENSKNNAMNSDMNNTQVNGTGGSGGGGVENNTSKVVKEAVKKVDGDGNTGKNEKVDDRQVNGTSGGETTTTTTSEGSKWQKIKETTKKTIEKTKDFVDEESQEAFGYAKNVASTLSGAVGGPGLGGGTGVTGSGISTTNSEIKGEAKISDEAIDKLAKKLSPMQNLANQVVSQNKDILGTGKNQININNKQEIIKAIKEGQLKGIDQNIINDKKQLNELVDNIVNHPNFQENLKSSKNK